MKGFWGLFCFVVSRIWNFSSIRQLEKSCAMVYEGKHPLFIRSVLS